MMQNERANGLRQLRSGETARRVGKRIDPRAFWYMRMQFIGE